MSLSKPIPSQTQVVLERLDGKKRPPRPIKAVMKPIREPDAEKQESNIRTVANAIGLLGLPAIDAWQSVTHPMDPMSRYDQASMAWAIGVGLYVLCKSAWQESVRKTRDQINKGAAPISALKIKQAAVDKFLKSLPTRYEIWEKRRQIESDYQEEMKRYWSAEGPANLGDIGRKAAVSLLVSSKRQTP